MTWCLQRRVSEYQPGIESWTTRSAPRDSDHYNTRLGFHWFHNLILTIILISSHWEMERASMDRGHD
uniref:Uncharacterized protein n=1 Tax=Timema tahoe TaxID=61484 RepID=A0A7R9IPM1_9NEOP|nr:unnamed protein product [Timema tahoe]